MAAHTADSLSFESAAAIPLASLTALVALRDKGHIQAGQQYDLIIDLIGNRSGSDLNHALAPNGRCVMVGFTSAQ